MGEIISIVLIVALVGGAIYYVVRAKKKGVKCIGCPDSANCKSANCQHCTCHHEEDK